MRILDFYLNLGSITLGRIRISIPGLNQDFLIWCARIQIIWALPCENVSLGICRQRRPRSDCASAQSDQGLRCLLTESLATAGCKGPNDALHILRNLYIFSSALSSACDFKSHFCKQCGPRSDCSPRSSLIWVHTVCLYAKIGLKSLQEYSADDITDDIFRQK